MQSATAESDREEIDEARRIIRTWGRNATAWQILNPGISLWLPEQTDRPGTDRPIADRLVGYVRRHGVCVAAGDPVAPPNELHATAARFEDAMQSRPICWFGASREFVALFGDDRGHRSILLGAQPGWHPDSWIEKLRNHPSLRAQLRRAGNKGVRIEEWSTDRAASNRDLRHCLQEWLRSRPFPPLHFLVEPRTLERPEGRRIFVALSRDRPVGYALLSPIPRRNGWLVEQFVRRPEAPNGTAELMVSTAVEAIAREGYDYVTLGLAPLSRHAGIPGEGTRSLRTLFGWLRLHGNRFYNFSGLDFFKAKFEPDVWEPIYALANRPRFSLRMLYAVAAAFSDGSPSAALARAILRGAVQELRWLVDRSRGG